MIDLSSFGFTFVTTQSPWVINPSVVTNPYPYSTLLYLTWYDYYGVYGEYSRWFAPGESRQMYAELLGPYFGGISDGSRAKHINGLGIWRVDSIPLPPPPPPAPPPPPPIEEKFAICQSGSIYSPVNAELSFGINDNDWTDNSGTFNIKLYNETERVTVLLDKNLDSSFPSWIKSYDLLANKRYYYTATGYVRNPITPFNISSGYQNYSVLGNTGIAGNQVTGLYTTTGYSVSNYVLNAAVGDYFAGTIVNPYSESITMEIEGTANNEFILNNLSIASATGSEIANLSFTSGLSANQSIPYYFRNSNNGGVAGGQLDISFKKSISQFLETGFYIYGLISKVSYAASLQNNSICNLSINCNDTGIILPAPPSIVSGQPRATGNGNIYFNLNSSGSFCSNGTGELSKLYSLEYQTNVSALSELNINKSISEIGKANSDYMVYAYYNTGTATNLYSYATGYQEVSSPTTYLTGYATGITGYVTGSGLILNKVVSATDGSIISCYESGVISVTSMSGVVTGITGYITGVAAPTSGIVRYLNYLLPTGVLATQLTQPDLELYVYNSGELIEYNDDWNTSRFYSYIQQTYNNSGNKFLRLTDTSPVGIYHADALNNSEFNIRIKNKSSDSIPNALVNVGMLLNNDLYPVYSRYNEPMKEAWTIYNVSGGTNSKNVISFAIDIASGYINTGKRIAATSLNLEPAIYTTGVDIRKQQVTYCIALDGCSADAGKEPQDLSLCWTGEAPPNAQYDAFLSGVLNKFASEPYTEYDPPNPFRLQTGVVPALFKYWSGELSYNGMQSGDKVKFELYPFDYTGLYRQYFSTAPLYPTTGVTLTHSVDFTGIHGLVSGLNSKLSGVSYPVWYPYGCVSGSGLQGIYIDGPLLSAYVVSGISGASDIVAFQSLRNNTGFKMSVDLSYPRIKYPDYKDSTVFLKPSTIRLQGSNNKTSWTDLYTASNIDWNNIEPTRLEVTGAMTGINDEIFDESLEEEAGDTVSIDGLLSTGFETIYSFTQSGVIKTKDKFCPPSPYERTIEIIRLTGVPPGTVLDGASCLPKELEQGESGTSPESSGANSQSTEPERYISLLRTGWNLSESYVGQPLTGISYNYYRVHFSGLEATAKWNEEIANNFLVKGINLYSCDALSINNHTGSPLCVIGSNYSGQIEGTVSVPLTGLLVDIISPADSGVYRLDNELVMMKISGYQSGSLIKFNNRSGRLLSNSGTGFLTDSITGTGCFTTGIADWFYNPSTEVVSFEQGFSTCISGSGRFTGQYIRLKPAYVNQELWNGGSFDGVFNVNINTGVFFTGFINTELPAYGITGIYNLTGSINGYAASGYYQAISGITFNTSGLNLMSDWVAGGATGYKNATAYLNYGTPQIFDYISINNKTVSYNSDTANYQSPDFFYSSGDLLNTINSYPIDFQVSAHVEAGLIKLTSLVSGETGNLIQVSAGQGDNTGTLFPTAYSTALTGGANFYRKLYATGIYTGLLSQVYLSTGYYYANDASGNLTGIINSYQGRRDFSGVWDIGTGNFHTGYSDFLLDNRLVTPFKYESVVGGTGYARTPSVFDIQLVYGNLYSVSSQSDVAKLTITGIGTNSGIVYYITGVN